MTPNANNPKPMCDGPWQHQAKDDPWSEESQSKGTIRTYVWRLAGIISVIALTLAFWQALGAQ